MKASDVVTREVVTTSPEARVKDVAVLMINYRLASGRREYAQCSRRRRSHDSAATRLS